MTERTAKNRPAVQEPEMYENLSANLRFLRRLPARDLSQSRMADLLFVPRRAYMNYENGKSLPPVYILYRMAVFFGYTMEALLTEKINQRKDG